MAVVTFASRLTGYLRDKALAWVLGAESLNDAFRTAFRIPNAFRALLAEGALHAAFVPALARLTDDGEPGREARELVRGLTAALLLAAGCVVSIGIVVSPWLVRLYAPGFVGAPDTFAATVLMNRLMFPYLALVSLAALLQGVLNSRERFLLPAATPILFNLSLAAGAWWLARGGTQAAPVVLSVAVLVGGVLQFVVQLPAVRALGFRGPSAVAGARVAGGAQRAAADAAGDRGPRRQSAQPVRHQPVRLQSWRGRGDGCSSTPTG